MKPKIIVMLFVLLTLLLSVGQSTLPAQAQGYPGAQGVDDAYTTNQDTPLTVDAPGVLANDIPEPSGTYPLLVAWNSDPANGALTLNQDGSFVYTPNAGYCGTDIFFYAPYFDDPASGPSGSSEMMGKVTITVTCPATGTGTPEPPTPTPTATAEPPTPTATATVDPASSGTTVTNTNDSGPGSLRQAIVNANANPGPDTINFDLTGCPCTIVLTGGRLEITDDVTINGPGATVLAVDGNNASLVLMISSGAASISGLTVQNGFVTADIGSGIVSLGESLTLTDAVVRNNGGDANAGGGIAGQNMTLTNVTVSGNSAYVGGGIYGENITLTNVTISDNTGTFAGGGLTSAGQVSLTNVTITGNTSPTTRGGITVSNGSITLVNTIVSNNSGPEGDCFVDPNGDGSVIDGGGNVSWPDAGCPGLNADPLLGPLADNGGPSQTHALLPGSPAIDIAAAGPATDQRGVARPQGSAFDSGAFEVEQSAPTPTATATPEPPTAPIAYDDNFTINEDTALSGSTTNVLANDYDAKGTGLKAIRLSWPIGRLTFISSGSFSYRPPANFCGTDGFTYKANDGTADSNVATVTITVACVNDAPVAVNDAYTTDAGTPLSVPASGVLSNDVDVENDLLTAVLVSSPANGALTLNADGSFSYTPNGGFSGADSFTYKANDGAADSNVATVTLTVNPGANQPPAVAADSAAVTVVEGQPATNSGTASDPDGDAVSLTASVGAVVNNNDGTWSWSFPPTDGPAQSQTVTISASDGREGAAQTSFELTVNNAAPTANAGPDQSVYRNDTVTLSGTWTDPAGAADNLYSWKWDLDGDTVADDSGTASYGDTVARTTSFAVDGAATLTFSVTDKDGATHTDSVQITVVNRAPTASNQSLSTGEDTALPVTLAAADADHDPLIFNTLSLPANGTLSGEPPHLTYTPNPDYFGADSFTFQVNDGLAESNVATVNINVISVNDPAVAVDDSATSDEDTPVVIDVQANDSAGPANEDQTLTTTDVTAPAHGAVIIKLDGSVKYTPALNYNGSDSFAYTVCDSDNGCATATVTVLVNTVNDPPVAANDTVTTAEDTPVTFNVLANDDDVDGNLDAGSARVVNPPANGLLTAGSGGAFTYTPNPDYYGPDSFSYEVCDTDDVCDDATVTITVTPVNDAPVCGAAAPGVSVLWPANHQWEPVTISGITDKEGDAISISIDSIFQDEPTNGLGDGDTSPDGQGLGSSSAQVRAERSGKGNGRYYHIGFTASDGNGGECAGTVQVNVPKSQGKKGAAVDDGPLYNSTQP